MNKFIAIITCCLLGAFTVTAQDWIKTLDGTLSKYPNKMLSLPNGDFLIGGVIYTLNSNISASTGFLMRTDPVGNILWEKRIGEKDANGNYTHTERIESIAVTTDGGIVVVGMQSTYIPNAFGPTDLLIAKYDMAGNEAWRKYLGLNHTDNALGVTALPAGEFVVCGNTKIYNNMDTDGFLLKMTPNGDIQWLNYYDRAHTNDALFDVILTSDQHLLAVGTTTYALGNMTMAIQTDLSGNQDWLNTYSDYSIKGNAIVEQGNGHYGFCGVSFGVNTNFDNLLSEIDKAGTEVWSKHYHAAANVPDELYDLLPCAEGGYVSVGKSGVSYLDGYHVLRVDAAGEVLKADYLFDGGINTDAATSLSWSAEGGIMVIGVQHKPEGTCGHDDMILTHFSDLGCSQPETSAIPELSAISVSVSPNPAMDYILVNAISEAANQYKFSLYNAAGSLVRHINSAQSSFSVNCHDLPIGTYTYTLQLEDGRASSGRLMIQR